MPTPYRYLRCRDLRSPGVMERCNGSLELRDVDDDDDVDAEIVGFFTGNSTDVFSCNKTTRQNAWKLPKYSVLSYSEGNRG